MCTGGQRRAPARSRRAPVQAAGSPKPSRPSSQAAHREFVLRPKSVRVVGARYPLEQRGPTRSYNEAPTPHRRMRSTQDRTIPDGFGSAGERLRSHRGSHWLGAARGGIGTHRWSRSIVQSAAWCRASAAPRVVTVNRGEYAGLVRERRGGPAAGQAATATFGVPCDQAGARPASPRWHHHGVRRSGSRRRGPPACPERDLRTSVLGVDIALPVIASPVGVQGVHPLAGRRRGGHQGRGDGDGAQRVRQQTGGGRGPGEP